MKKTEFLQDALGLVDEELVTKAHEPMRRSKVPAWARWVAAAACLSILIGGGFLLLPKKNTGELPTQYNLVAENLWEQEGFTAFSLTYGNNVPQAFSAATASESTADFVSQPISISQTQTVKFERLIAQRYAVYRGETGFIMFYDTVEDKTLDLQERILGDTSAMLNELLEICRAKAWELYPEFMAFEPNRQILDLYLTYLANDSISVHWDEITAITPDTSFWDPDQHASEEEKNYYCWNLPWEIFCKAELSNELMYAPYAVSVLGIDEYNGICIIATNGMNGVSAEFWVYDVQTDSSRPLTKEAHELPIYLQRDGYSFRFSSDGKIATVVYPEATISGGNVYGDLTHRFVIDTVNREINNYRGEGIGIFFLEDGTCQAFADLFIAPMGFASSEWFISETNSVLYYKKFDPALAGKSFYASDLMWYNRLNLHNVDTDYWVFRRVGENNQLSGSVELQGNFVRLAANDTIAIMERGGRYFAYSLTDGADVTQDVLDGRLQVYAHQRLLLSHENGQIFATDLFTGNRHLVCQADAYNPSADGAFVFAYCRGENVVSCYNIATLESCSIQLDEAMQSQLLETEGAELQMSYNQEEKNLLLSYYLPEDISSRYVTDLDFRALLAQMEVDNFIHHLNPVNPVELQGPAVSEAIVELFRDSVRRYNEANGNPYWLEHYPGAEYYPEGLSRYQQKEGVFAWLGVEEPKDYLNVNGVRLILFSNGEETLQMTFKRCWLLFDYQDGSSGFTLEYITGAKTYQYSFSVEPPPF